MINKIKIVLDFKGRLCSSAQREVLQRLLDQGSDRRGQQRERSGPPRQTQQKIGRTERAIKIWSKRFDSL